MLNYLKCDMMTADDQVVFEKRTKVLKKNHKNIPFNCRVDQYKTKLYIDYRDERIQFNSVMLFSDINIYCRIYCAFSVG